MPGLLRNVPELLRGSTMEDIRTEFPELSDDQIRAWLVHHAHDYGCNRLEDGLDKCGMAIPCEQGVTGEHFVVEIVDEELRNKFGFHRYNLYRGPRISKCGGPEVIGFDTLKAARAAYDSGWNDLLRT